MKQEMIGSERPDQALMCVQFILYTWRLGLSSKVKSSYLVITIKKLLSSKQPTHYFRILVSTGYAAHPAVVPDTAGPGTGLHLGWLHRPSALPRQPARRSVHHHYHNMLTCVHHYYHNMLLVPFHLQACGPTCREVSAAAPGGWTVRWPSSRAPTPASARSPRRTSAGAAPGSSCSAGV